ncbi:MAG: alpha-amylase [Oscillatoria princeps RMCB-10]|jgi:1,4-alpha-glucan branching enzyme|nr:alpha-amylase [Oscillatoria princeps RMCB-10]
MKLLPLNKLGAREVEPGTIEFGLLLPWVSAKDGNKLRVKVIHEADQFLQDIQPSEFDLAHSIDEEYGDYWSAKVEINSRNKPHHKSAWGSPGRYVYRYCLNNPNHPEIDWIIDPFAREFGTGKLSAFTLGYQDYVWSDSEKVWKTPALNELVMYELMISEFGGDIEKAIERLDYLADLGINCIEVMPVSNVAMTVDWGFLPIGYFGVDERFGKRKDFQKFIDAAHQRKIAVILDAVYGHTGDSFPYSYVYRKLGYTQNPFMGAFAKDYFGESTDFNRKFTQDFFFTVNSHWLDCYHVDGFRYDCVPNYWDGAAGKGYANLTYSTYQTVKEKKDAGGHWQKFFNSGAIHLIQCAEQLEAPQEILWSTYSNCTWQNETLGAAKAVAYGDRARVTDLGFRFGLDGYPAEVTANNDKIAKTALQYIENHDHSRFVCNFGTISRDNDILREGNRDLWYKVQPYLIAMLAGKGIPMLWQGQELGENYYIPEAGFGRVMLFRPVRWDYFYDSIGKSVISLVRTLIKLRREQPQFQYGNYFFYNHYDRYQSKNVLLFSRQHGNSFSLVALNFGDSEQWVPFWFPISGYYQEELHGIDNLPNVPSDSEYWLKLPSNYGSIWTVKTA